MSKSLFFLALFLLSGCATTKHVIDARKTELMPESVARQIIDKNIGHGWIKQPYLVREAICGGNRVDINLGEIVSAVYLTSKAQLLLTAKPPYSLIPYACIPRIFIKLSSVDAAKETISALHALGATVNHLTEIP